MVYTKKLSVVKVKAKISPLVVGFASNNQQSGLKQGRVFSANTGRWNYVGLMLGQRRRHWLNALVFAGMGLLPLYIRAHALTSEPDSGQFSRSSINPPSGGVSYLSPCWW